MSDLIKREDVMALWEKYHPYIAVKAIEFGNALKEIPSAVPTPHGRLVDADAIEEKSGDWFVTELDTVGFSGSLREFLSEQPTVVKAEANHEYDEKLAE